MMMGIYFMDETPFEDVYLHAMVRDKEGRKMSKTVGNVIDPVHMIRGAEPEELDEEVHGELLKQYPDGVEPQGADALRFTLAIYAAQGRDIKLDISRMEGYRAFLNKLWNAARFTLMNLEDWEAPYYEQVTGEWDDERRPFDEEALSIADRWILSRLDRTIDEVQTALEEYHFDDAAQTLYDFIWHEFCDWYIELVKDVLYESDDDAPERRAAQTVLTTVLETSLRLMHPFTPYVTEEIWQELPKAGEVPDSIMIAPWPETRPEVDYPEAVEQMELLIGLIGDIRGIRGETNVKPGTTIDEVTFVTENADAEQAIEEGAQYIRSLASVDGIVPAAPDEVGEIEGVATSVHESVETRIPMRGLIDIDEELDRLHKELERVEEDLDYVRGKLDNQGFVENAPEEIVEQEREKLEGYLDEKEKLESSVEELEELKT